LQSKSDIFLRVGRARACPLHCALYLSPPHRPLAEFLARLILRVPLWPLCALSSLVYWIVFYLTNYRRYIIDAQMNKVFPELSITSTRHKMCRDSYAGSLVGEVCRVDTFRSSPFVSRWARQCARL
jgi:lauroyl/myristoyl acyltransferase